MAAQDNCFPALVSNMCSPIATFQQAQDEMVTYAGSVNNFTQENAAEKNGNVVVEEQGAAETRRRKSQVNLEILSCFSFPDWDRIGDLFVSSFILSHFAAEPKQLNV